jgi:hypothetical protein
MSGADFPDDFLAAGMTFPNAQAQRAPYPMRAAIKAM